MPSPPKTVDESPLGFTWVMDEEMGRGCHALAEGGQVWLIDPVDFDGLEEKVRKLGEPAAVIQLLDRHWRDCKELSERWGVPHHRTPDELPGTPFEVIKVLNLPVWRERALWWADRQALVVAEVVGTNALFTGGSDRAAGIHPMLRVRPPRILRGRSPQHLLMGHGDPIHGPEATDALELAYARSRKDIPRVIRNMPGPLSRYF
ncbi:hypothetical protein HJD18_13865 [Thermoleophilia bacterium SCSIO 60948]|nr:hypothetical protein HJD18_13865 [Thermoleophilia bacterium SCSIO 60948]